MNADQRRTLDGITQDLDLLVYKLEATEASEGAPTPTELLGQRRRLRRELEALRDRLQHVVDGLW